uniref:Putative secreted protein n=1 Tax=Ixodes ricinus TaxID=34613 RepID=A0A6B0UK11_IXORI
MSKKIAKWLLSWHVNAFSLWVSFMEVALLTIAAPSVRASLVAQGVAYCSGGTVSGFAVHPGCTLGNGGCAGCTPCPICDAPKLHFDVQSSDAYQRLKRIKKTRFCTRIKYS